VFSFTMMTDASACPLDDAGEADTEADAEGLALTLALGFGGAFALLLDFGDALALLLAWALLLTVPLDVAFGVGLTDATGAIAGSVVDATVLGGSVGEGESDATELSAMTGAVDEAGACDANTVAAVLVLALELATTRAIVTVPTMMTSTPATAASTVTMPRPPAVESPDSDTC
jgi:hypothetical protein